MHARIWHFELESMSLEDKDLGVRKVIQKGGSLTVTLPSEVVEILKLKSRQKLAFIQDGKTKRVYIMRQQDLVSLLKLKRNLEGVATLLGRELTKDEIQEIIENLKTKKSP